MMQLIFRFIVGGLIVSLFAAISDALNPKSFAGLFGAAPSVALATLGLTILTVGKAYAAIEARSMIAGALSSCLYAALREIPALFVNRVILNKLGVTMSPRIESISW
jgi:hypothetical protein